MQEHSTNADDSPSPPTAGGLVRIRAMFVIPEAYVIAVAVWAGWTPVSLLFVTPNIAAVHGGAAALGVMLLAAPMLVAAIFLLRRRRSARALLMYASVISGAVIGAASESPWMLLVYAHQALLVALLWLPRIDAVLSPAYRNQVMAATPLVGRSRRAAWACAFLAAMLVTVVAVMVALVLVG